MLIALLVVLGAMKRRAVAVSSESTLTQATLADSAHAGDLFVGYVPSYVVDVAGKYG